MGQSLLLYCTLCFFQLLLFHFPSLSSSLAALCNHDESAALIQFNKSFTLDISASHGCYHSYPKTASWENGTDCCLWDGVTCDTKSGYVIGLDLSCSWLQGKFHPNSTLFQLTHLQKLNLAFNDFYQSPLFSRFGDLVTLTHLNLSQSGLHGVIPPKISHLSKLVSLDLSYSVIDSAYSGYLAYASSYNNLTLEPSTWEKLILNVTNLRELDLQGVNMFLIKPRSLSLLMNLSTSLAFLSLQNTRLYGNFPNTILCLPNLQMLDLSRNRDPRLIVFEGSEIQDLKGELPKSNWSTPLKYLDLSDTAFSGKLPYSIGHLKSLSHLDLSYCNFDGLIPLSLWNLTQLTYLSLTSNNFTGEIPLSLSNLQYLTTLHLSHNNLGGQLPSSLVDLTQLSYLNCGYNKLIGPIPDKIGRLSNLFALDLSHNLLNGAIPQGCFSLPSLFYLSLSDNQLTGPLGEFSTYSMARCILSNNNLQGNIPKSMFDLLSLTELRLSSNNLSGFLDFHQFSKLRHLGSLDLSHNNFLSLSFDSSVHYTFPELQYIHLSSCNIDSFPKFLEQLQNLQLLDLSSNKIHGRIPKWLNNTRKDLLYYLDLSHNFLTSVGNLSLSGNYIRFIDLSYNLLQGDLPIPPSATEFYSVSNNNFTGDISSVICNASSLNILNLSNNNLTGRIPQCLGSFPLLWVLDLQMNKLHGTIPDNFSEGNMLETIKLNGNQLEGPLPQSLAQCKFLEVLDLGENNIKDTFPSWLEHLQDLQVLILRANQFHGVITHLKTKDPFPILSIFDVSSNSFSGPLPTTYIRNFKGMMNVDDRPTGLQYMIHSYSNLKSYNDSVLLTVKGNDVQLERILITFTTIDFSNNSFEGEIPEVIGELKSLIGLNLSHNRITGNIPQSLGNMTSLEWLDLSSNKLMGNIPLALTNLNYLSFLNVSQNKLEGIIPTGRQFNTFQNDSYNGNPGLCGFPLSKSCNNDEEPPSDYHKEQLGFGWKAVVIGYACGVVFGMLLGCIVFSIGKPQWLVRLVGSVPNKRGRNRRNRALVNHRGMN